MLGVENKYVNDEKIPVTFLTKIKIVISFLHFLKSTPRSMEKLNRKFEADLIIFKEQVQSQNSLQDLLDTYKDTSRLNIILMANGLEQLDGRIIGDRSLIGPFVSEYLEVKPFSLVDMKSLGLHYAKDDLRTVFAVTGGLPAYVQYFDNGESIDTNIINLFFSVTGALFEETQYILHRDMKNITGANAILTGLASLERPYYVELLQESQIKSGTFTSRLNDLMSMGLVGRIQASNRGNAKYADYHFTNSMFHFWYRYVYKYWGDIVRGYGADVYYNHVKPQLNDFVQAACIAI